MTIRELADLLERRQAAWDELGHDDRDLRDLPPERRMRMERASAGFRAADAAIVGELRRRNAPVRVGDVELWLTRDRLSFVAVDPATGDPACNPSDRGSYRSLLYRYPEPAAQRRGAGA